MAPPKNACLVIQKVVTRCEFLMPQDEKAVQKEHEQPGFLLRIYYEGGIPVVEVGLKTSSC